MKNIFLMLLGAVFLMSSCAKDKINHKVLTNLNGEWTVKSAFMRRWDKKIGEKNDNRSDLNGQIYTFNNSGGIVHKSASGDSIRSGNLIVWAEGQSNYILHVTYIDKTGMLYDKEFWEIINGRGRKITVYIESKVGELQLNLEKL